MPGFDLPHPAPRSRESRQPARRQLPEPPLDYARPRESFTPPHQPSVPLRRPPVINQQAGPSRPWESPASRPAQATSFYYPSTNIPPIPQPQRHSQQHPTRPGLPLIFQPGVNVAYRPRYPIYKDMAYELSVDDLAAQTRRTPPNNVLPVAEPPLPNGPNPKYVPPMPSTVDPEDDDVPLAQVVRQRTPSPPRLVLPPVLFEPAVAETVRVEVAVASPIRTNPPPPITPKRETSVSDLPIAMTGEMQPSSAFFTDIWEEEDERIDEVSIVVEALRRQRDEDDEQDELMDRIAKLLKSRNTGRSYTSSTTGPSRSGSLLSPA